MIDKYITTNFEVKDTFDSAIKVANWQPEVHVPEEISAFIQNLKPEPEKFAYVHLIAMSDGDTYGSNMNGDIFTADQLTGIQSQLEADKNPGEMQGICLPRFKTFEQAKLFKHHANDARINPHFGDVPLAVWNDVMRRVELIVRIAKQAVPELGMSSGLDLAVKLDRRGYLTVSMGTRISHEKCRYCGHENEFVHQRCDHLKNHMNEIMPDGRMVTAENFGCRFFDISDVTIPADPIAYSLQKIASGDAPRTVNVAIDPPEAFGEWAAKHSEIQKRSPCGPDFDDCPWDSKAKRIPEFSEEELSKAASCASDLDTVLSTAAVAGVVFSPRELVYLTGVFEPEKLSSATPDFSGFGRVVLDKFSPFVYHALQEKLASRSGFLAPCLDTGWEPTKIAQEGFDAVSRYYAYYRACLDQITPSAFTKAAHRCVPDLLGDSASEHSHRVQGALYHLAYAGISA